jgi:hypothetical protein
MLLAAIRVAPTDPVGISGANIAEDCQFPSVVAFRAGETSCSGSIVHPRVMVTAAHCLAAGSPDRVRFGEAYAPYEHRLDVERCEVYPAYAESDAATDDLAFCVLVQSADELPPIPLLAGCEVEHLQRDTVAVIVGFGIPAEGESYGRKHYAFTTVYHVADVGGTVMIGDDGANGCIGDSGGPALVQLPDGTWRAVGVFSRGPDCGGGPSTYRVLADRLAWIEERSGFDITPCFDDDGEWEASPECAGFDADPRTSDGDWDHYCDGERLAPTQTCQSQQSDTSSASSSSESSASSESSGSAESSTSASSETDASEGCGCRTDSAPERAFLWVVVAFVAGYSARTCKRTRDQARRAVESDRWR